MSEQPPDFREILDWVEGRLSADRAARVEAYAACDARVRRSAAWVRSFVTTTTTHPVRRPPASVRAALNQEFTAWRAARSGAEDGAPAGPATAEPMVAALVFDSRSDLAGASVRSGEPTAPGRDPGDDVEPWSAVGAHDEMVHLAFTSTVADLVLDLAGAGPGRLVIDGQVLPLDDGFAGAVDIVVDGPGRSWSATCDEVGRFTVAGVDPSATVVRVVGAGGEVVARWDRP